MRGTHKHMEAWLKYFDNHRCVSQSEVSTVCSHTFTLFWSRKTFVIVEMFQLSFHVIKWAFYLGIFSFFSMSFSFLSLFFVLSVLRYFPLHFTCFAFEVSSAFKVESISFFIYLNVCIHTSSYLFPCQLSLTLLILHKLHLDTMRHKRSLQN